MKSRSTVVALLLAPFAASLVACSVSAEPAPSPSPAPSATAPGTTDPAPSDPSTTPTDPVPATPPSPKLDATFAGGAGISDSTHEIQSAVSGPGGVTYVALRKAGGSIGWGNGTLVRRYTAAADGTLHFIARSYLPGLGSDGRMDALRGLGEVRRLLR